MSTQPRALASLTVSFGLVAIPVKMYSATMTSEKISFHWLRAGDRSRVKEQFIAVNDGKVVERSQMIKGYEFSKGKFVTFTPDELKALEDMTTRSIEVQQFVPLESVDPVYFMETYYLAPDQGGSEPYALFVNALQRTKQCAVGRWVSRGKEHIVVIRSTSDVLALQQLHFEAEVRPVSEIKPEAVKISESELKLAEQLINHLAANRFDPHEYHDEFKARVQTAIKRKVQGKDIALEEPAAPKAGNVVDLMSALKASLAGGKGKAAENGERKAPKKAGRSAQHGSQTAGARSGKRTSRRA